MSDLEETITSGLEETIASELEETMSLQDLETEKPNLKRKFTSSKNSLLNVLSEETPDKKDVRQSLLKFDNDFNKVSELVSQLITHYRSTQDVEKVKKIEVWFEAVEDQHTEVSGPANKFLAQSSIVSSKANLRKQEQEFKFKENILRAQLEESIRQRDEFREAAEQVVDEELGIHHQPPESRLPQYLLGSTPSARNIDEQIGSKDVPLFRNIDPPSARNIDEQIGSKDVPLFRNIDPPGGNNQQHIGQSGVISNGYSQQPNAQNSNNSNIQTLGPIATADYRIQDMSRDLERLPLPKFSGNKLDYEDWKVSFETCVGNQPWDTKRKILRLKACLEGEAKDLVRGLDNSEIAYITALDRLEKEYGGSRRIVARHLASIRDLKIIQEGNSKDLRRFANTLDVAIVALTNHNHLEELGDGMLHQTAKSKFPKNLLVQYKHWIRNNRQQDSLKSLREWVLEEYRILIEAEEDTSGFKGDSTMKKAKSFSKAAYNQNNPQRNYCILCKGDHKIRDCEKFKSKSLKDRWSIAKSKGLCYRCLGRGHLGSKCKTAKTCTFEGCDGTHNPLLHNDVQKAESRFESASPTSRDQSETYRKRADSNLNQVNCKSVSSMNDDNLDYVSLRSLPVLVSNGDKAFKVMGVLDDCSTASYISESLASELELPGELTELNVSMVAGKQSTLNTMCVSVKVSNVDNSYQKDIKAYTVKRVSDYSPVVDWDKLKNNWEHLKNIPFAKLPKNHTIDLLIGVDAAELHRCISEVYGADDLPIARKTPLGWNCVGSLKKHSVRVTNTAFAHFVTAEKGELNSMLRKFWEIDSGGTTCDIKSLYTPDERSAVKTVETSRKYVDGRYETGIPWKQGEPDLENNWEIAMSRLVNLEKSLQKRPEVAQEYNSIIEKQVEKGYIRKIPKEELNCEDIKTQKGMWFLPHFAVVKPERETSRVRIVLDASAKLGDKSLNDAIHAGPKLYHELFDILIRFRRYAVALVGDISEMFLQVGLKESDRPYHRFIWRNMETDREPDCYEFLRITFGNTSSPYLAQDIVQYHANLTKDKYPSAADTVFHAMYMDDVTDSRENAESGIQLRRELTDMLAEAGFKIRKWCSNDQTVLLDIPENDRAKDIDLKSGALPCLKTLGVRWKSDEDMFTFAIEIPSDVKYTKRGVLQKVATIYDPIGFITPFIIRAKILLQKAWINGLDWDQEFPVELASEWRDWFNELSDLCNFSIPRCIQLQSDAEISLHTFVDASMKSYAAVTYIRICKPDNVYVLLVASKAKVAPLKTISIPRLELLAAMLGLNLAKNICSVLKIDISEHTFWSDSQNVLYWIRGQSKHYKPFVAHRIGNIHENTTPEQWRYVPGEINPADIASRGTKANNLNENWIYGPEFLYTDDWPENIKVINRSVEIDKEIRKSEITGTVVVENRKLLEIETFSSWNKLKTVTAWWLRFAKMLKTAVKLCCRSDQDTVYNKQLWIEKESDCDTCKNLKKSIRSLPKCLLVRERKEAEIVWIQKAQSDNFQQDISELQKNKCVRKKSNLFTLNPQLDDKGLLRIDGRLKLAKHLPFNTRCPIILPRKHHVTKLVIGHFHEMLNHDAGVDHVLCEIRMRFWIIHGRQAVNEYHSDCSECAKRRAQPSEQIMSPLPDFRTEIPLRAFSRCGIDFAGPFYTKQGRGRAQLKRYLCLFTCINSRAVHLEMCWSMDTDSFLEAFSRMCARRGRPDMVVSDNGSNLAAGEKELRDLVMSLDYDKIERKSAEKGIQWIFTPPGGPHHGGIFEAMIKSAKRAIRAVLQKTDLTDEELLTAFTIAEGVVNSRPLTHQSADPKDDVPLTPNHFLFGMAGGELAPVTNIVNPHKRWYYLQRLITDFWKRWLKELIPTLNAREKWHREKRDIEIGDIVLCVDKDTPRGQWPLGRVLEIYPGKDGHTRVTKVKIGNKELIRPITRLCPLDLKAETKK